MKIAKIALAGLLAASVPAIGHAQDQVIIGTGGTASVGGTSATTLGTAGASTNDDGDYAASIGTGGSAAAVGGKVKVDTKVNANKNKLQGQSKASAQDKGTFSKSKTKVKVKGGELSSRTKTMAHEPGSGAVIQREEMSGSLGD